MPIHRIRLKAPWLVTALQSGKSIEPPPGVSKAKLDLPDLLQRFLETRTEPVDIQATRRFHRPTGLTPSSSVSISVNFRLPPSRVLFGPIAPGEQASQKLRALAASPISENRTEFVLPNDLQLRSELRLEWDQLSPDSSLESLVVELLIREPEDE